MPPPTTAFRLAELVFKGDLAEFITSRRKPNPPVAWDRIARDLYEATGGEVDVTGVTISKWADRLETKKSSRAAS